MKNKDFNNINDLMDEISSLKKQLEIKTIENEYLREKLRIGGVSNTLKAYTEWQDTTDIDLGAYTNEEQYKLYLDSF